MKIKALLIFIVCLFFIGQVGAQEKQVIRVAISNQNFSNYEYQNIKISSSDSIKIIDMSQSSPIEPIPAKKIVEVVMENSFYNIYVDGTLKHKDLMGPLVISSNADLEIVELNRKGIPAKYKGMIELRNAKNNITFNVINIVDMQNYLRGVVSNEMPISFGLEALKAQSVAARNYATNAIVSPNYDVVDSTQSQVYYGSNSYKDVSDLAVAQTKGIYALYNEKPITALYFSTSTGITDDWEEVFGTGIISNKHPYLKPRYDLNNKPLKNEKDVEEFLSKKDNGLDMNSPKFRWEFECERELLEQTLHKTLQEQSKKGLVSPSYDGDIELVGLKEIRPLKRTQSGKITEILLVAKSGEYKIRTQLGIRRALKINNTLMPSSAFFVQASKKEEVVKELNEEDKEGFFDFFNSSSDDKYPVSFKFIGGGFGHGVGMSQYGASALARDGKTYPEILNHYYTDIKISTMPTTVEFNDYNYFYRTDFYFEPNIHKNAYLYINNQRGASEFPFKINEYEFLETQKVAKEKVAKINITSYLKEGENMVVFAPLTQNNKGKYVIYRVEFE